MSKFESLGNVIQSTFRPASLLIRKHSPEILTATGIVGVVVSGALLIRQTLKVEPIVEEHRDTVERTRSVLITPAYSDNDLNRDVAKVYLNTGLKLARHYGPAITIGAAGLMALLASHGLMKQRNVALAAGYKAIESAFGEYRKRVAEVVGEEAELELYHHETAEIRPNPETGELEKHVTSKGSASVYAKFFDENSIFWTKTPEANLAFLINKQDTFNDRLRARGIVFLNEVYRELDIPCTQLGNIVGWEYDGDGDGEILFGIHDYNSPEARAFVNGRERVLRMDFNVDGPILHNITKY